MRCKWIETMSTYTSCSTKLKHQISSLIGTFRSKLNAISFWNAIEITLTMESNSIWKSIDIYSNWNVKRIDNTKRVHGFRNLVTNTHIPPPSNIIWIPLIRFSMFHLFVRCHVDQFVVISLPIGIETICKWAHDSNVSPWFCVFIVAVT